MNQNDINKDQLNSKPVMLNIPDFMDDLNIDETSFKPVTKGLGFHQEVKQKQFTPAAVNVTKLQHEPIKKNIEIGKSIAKSFDDKKIKTKSNTITAQTTTTKGALAAFYADASVSSELSLESEKVESSLFNKKETIKKVDASMYAQFIAYIVDVALVLSFTIATIAALVLVSRIDYRLLMKMISLNDQVVFGSSLFIIYYLLYFTILDLNASPGKSLMGIRLYTASGKNVSTKHTFGRALITLLSVAALTLPTILDFQGRLSGTKVFKD